MRRADQTVDSRDFLSVSESSSFCSPRPGSSLRTPHPVRCIRISEAMLKRGGILRECASQAPKAQKDDSLG